MLNSKLAGSAPMVMPQCSPMNAQRMNAKQNLNRLWRIHSPPLGTMLIVKPLLSSRGSPRRFCPLLTRFYFLDGGGRSRSEMGAGWLHEPVSAACAFREPDPEPRRAEGTESAVSVLAARSVAMQSPGGSHG